MTTKKIGNVWIADDAEYGVRDTASGSSVVRADGAVAEFLSRAEAEEAAEMLAKCQRNDSDYYWTAPSN